MTSGQSETIAQALKQAVHSLQLPQLEAEVLLAHLLNKPRSHLYAWPEQPLSAHQKTEYQQLVERRCKGEPIAYITGHREFWSLRLTVTPDTLIPRPETELLVERALLHLPPASTATVADLGTGSGAIAAAIASERPRIRLVATDRSAEALSVAKSNFLTLGLQNIEARTGSWLSALKPSERYDLILSNPPYVADRDPHLLQDDLQWEPLLALTSGADGLQDIRELIHQAPSHLSPQGWLIIEHGADQGPAVRQLFSEQNYREITTHQDLESRDRLTEGRRPVDDVCNTQRTESH